MADLAPPSPALSPAARAAWIARRVADIDQAVQQDLSLAIALSGKALAEGIEHPMIFNLLAYQAEEEGRFDLALSLLDRAAGLAPGDVYIWNAVGLCLLKQDRINDAITAFQHALTLDPAFPQANYNLGSALESLGDYDLADEHFRTALKTAPNYADAWAGLAATAVRRGDIEVVREMAGRAQALEPGHPGAGAALANAHLMRRDFAQAEAALRPMVDDARVSRDDRPTILCLYGEALDGLGRIDDAFGAYSAGKAAFRDRWRDKYEAPGLESQREFAERLGSYFATAIPDGWQAPSCLAPHESSPATGHAFLVGFPRSGTTLLEQLFASHPDMTAIDERAALRDVEDAYLSDTAGLNRLANLNADEAVNDRTAYWEAVRKAKIAPEGRYVVDKMPLYSVKTPLIHKLFPGVKILFALRDPRDVVLSCFRRPFQMNAGMYQFTTLESAALYYDCVMTLMQTYRAVLPLNEHIIRYEALVEAPEQELRAVCTFLGVDWTAEMLDFATKARTRTIRTPSAAQVRRGLYKGGADQWRRYARHIEPVLPILQPWVEKFGYAHD